MPPRSHLFASPDHLTERTGNSYDLLAALRLVRGFPRPQTFYMLVLEPPPQLEAAPEREPVSNVGPCLPPADRLVRQHPAAAELEWRGSYFACLRTYWSALPIAECKQPR